MKKLKMMRTIILKAQQLKLLILVVVAVLLSCCCDYCITDAFQIPLLLSSFGIKTSVLIVPVSPETFVYKQQSIAVVQQQKQQYTLRLSTDDWSNFKGFDNDIEEDILLTGKAIDRRKYVTENDTIEDKIAAGLEIDEPFISNDNINNQQYEPLFVPPGSQLELDEDIVQSLLCACRIELGTLFGYTVENRGVGITGSVEYVETDGGIVYISLQGRYWHQRTTVLDRIGNYLQQRIPELLSVDVIDQYQLTDDANQ